MKKKFNFALYFSVFSCMTLLVTCAKDSETSPSDDKLPNVLLIIADDLGKDAINGYVEGSIKPSTPNLDKIRDAGLNFTNFWVNPTCTPTRASIITGKYGYRTNVKWAGDELSPSETTLQKYIHDESNGSYASAVVGKWHLSGNNLTVNPESFGIDYYAGLIRGAVDDYYRWQLTEDGSSSLQTSYITEHLTDLSIQWIQKQTKPWFMWLAYNAPHTPFHLPPADMHHQGDLPDYENGMDATPYYLAAIEAMDFQIGRLLESMSTTERENTVIIFIGDNGTPNQVAQSPYSAATAKGTLYQGGINVPMFISGKGISRNETDDNLITGTDLFATIAEISGLSTPQIHDSQSFKSLFSKSSTLKNFQYSEMNDGTNDAWTIRNEEYKLIDNSKGNAEMYNLKIDPYEQNNLLTRSLSSTESTAKQLLEMELLQIRN